MSEETEKKQISAAEFSVVLAAMKSNFDAIVRSNMKSGPEAYQGINDAMFGFVERGDELEVKQDDTLALAAILLINEHGEEEAKKIASCVLEHERGSSLDNDRLTTLTQAVQVVAKDVIANETLHETLTNQRDGIVRGDAKQMAWLRERNADLEAQVASLEQQLDSANGVLATLGSTTPLKGTLDSVQVGAVGAEKSDIDRMREERKHVGGH
ncbi:MAG: hypothetical protein COV36_04305 [Alphaproteobacteria bacterium CG11_big_fil_rev_8_21_14_0_20_44_7]|nr:MAG: hypothetical protein COV36_04305 [Alphaproteobacteria bacterium CG11_big_fil_rev_8_21_14_0_20_44_7]